MSHCELPARAAAVCHRRTEGCRKAVRRQPPEQELFYEADPGVEILRPLIGLRHLPLQSAVHVGEGRSQICELSRDGAEKQPQPAGQELHKQAQRVHIQVVVDHHRLGCSSVDGSLQAV